MLKVLGDIDTVLYLDSDSFETALGLLFRDLSDEINTLLDIFSRKLNIKVSASVIDFSRIKNQEFFIEMEKFVISLDKTLARRSLQYAKIATKYLDSKQLHLVTETEILNRMKTKKELNKYLSSLAATLKRLNGFSQVLLSEYKAKGISLPVVQSDPDLKYVFSKLDLFSYIILTDAIKFLQTEGEIAPVK
jgi:hypothetical protein